MAVGDTVELVYHPDYLTQIDRWNEISDFVDGDLERVRKYLIPYDSELPDQASAEAKAEAQRAWRSRNRRLTTENECDPPLQVHVSCLNQAINWGALADDPQMKVIIDDATGYERSAHELLSDIVSLYLQHGKCAVLVDGPREIAASRAQALEAGERSYQVLYEAQHLVNWKLFKSGKRKGKPQEVWLVEEPYITADGKTLKQYARFFFPNGDNTTASDKFVKQILRAQDEKPVINPKTKREELKVVEEYQGALNVIPLEIIGRGLKDSWLKDVAPQNRFLLNEGSVRDNVLWYTAYQRTIVAGATPDKIKSMAEFQITAISNPDARVHTIEASDPTSIFRQISERKARTRRLAMRQFNRIVSEDSREEPSAAAKAMDEKTRVKSYDAIIALMQRKLTNIFEFHALYEGYTEPIAITIANEYGLEDIEQTELKKSMAFARAQQLGVSAVARNVLKQDIQGMRVVPDDDETEEACRQRLMQAVDASLTPEQELRTVPNEIFGDLISTNGT